MQRPGILTTAAFILALLIGNSALAADNSAILGKWELNFSIQGRDANPTLTISAEADGLSGTWAGPRGSAELSAVSFDGETLSFSRAGRQGRSVNMVLKLVDGALIGKFDTPMGEIPVTGKKAS